jgi:cell division protein ZapA
MDELTISVTIADRPYRLKIRKEEEERVRKAAKRINERIKQYSDNYAYNDRQDLLAMVSLEFANSSMTYETQLNETDHEIEDKLTEIDNILSEQLD